MIPAEFPASFRLYAWNLKKSEVSILLSSCVQSDEKIYRAEHTNLCHREVEISVFTFFIIKLVHERYVISRISV